MLASKKNALRKTAVDWFLRLQNMDVESSERSAFEAWLMASPSHQEAYAEVSGVWQKLDSTPQLQQLASALESKNKSSRTRKIKAVSAALSLVLTVCLSVFLVDFWQSQPTMEVVATADIGQTKTQLLDDGSKFTINASSNIEVVYYRNKRLVKLHSGEAIFEVAKNIDRPFIVESENARVTVLGTRFAVNKLDTLVRVSVDHGRVKVEGVNPYAGSTSQDMMLSSGEVAEISAGLAPRKVDRPAQDAFSFEKGLITFTNANLSEISETLSRYRQQPVLVKSGQQLNAKITAVIKQRNVENFLNHLPDLAPVRLEQQNGQLQISEK
jgi:transmembrane sensor